MPIQSEPFPGTRAHRRLAGPVRLPRAALLATALLAGGWLVACGNAAGGSGESAPPPALAYEGSAYDLAGRTDLPEREPEELPGLHNVFRLSDDVISGAEPAGEEAFASLAAMGVRTILSVDGKAPDAEAAERHGLRYVHVPIQYKGVAPEEMGDIAKTFRELPGPFYVHCYHGKHRGPTAAAIGRMVLDDAPREECLAEMRQWCGTSKDYEGLFAAIAKDPVPDARATDALDFGFPSAKAFRGIRSVMIPMPRAFDALKAMAKLDWAVDPTHPDGDPTHEAELVHSLSTELAEQEDAQGQPADFQGWMAEAQAAALELHEALAAGREGLAPDRPLTGAALARVDAAFGTLSADCKSCHAVYRN